MKITLTLFAILAIIGLGQSHQFPDFGQGPLHEDIQDILDLVPVEKILKVFAYYAKNDPEVQSAIQYFATTPILKTLLIDFESIPEVINLLNYLYEENVEVYYLINQLNKIAGIKELIPPGSTPLPTEPSSPTPTDPSSPTPTEPSTPTPTEPSSPTPTDPSSPTSTEPSTPTPTDPSTPTPTEPSTPTPTEPSTPTPTEPSTPTPTEPSTPTPTEPSTPTPTEPSTPTPTEPSTPTPTEPPTSPSTAEPTSSPVPTSPSTAEPTSSPIPTSPSTAEPTSSPVPTSPSTAEPTSSPVPTSPSTAEPTSSPVPTSPSTAEPTSSPVPTSSSTAGSTSSPVATSPSTAGPTSSPVPTPTPTSESKHFFYTSNGFKIKTGGLAGLFKTVKRLFNYDAFISVYVDKLKHSSAFVNFVNELKSENFQLIVNKIFETQSFQAIQHDVIKDKVNLKIVGDILYLVFGISIPEHVKSLEEHFIDFISLLPLQKMIDITVKYLNEDKQVQDAILFLTTPEFHDLLRAVETLKEHQELVIYLQTHGINIIEQLQEFHKAIGMEDYVPPKIEKFLKAQIKTQEVGGGMHALFGDLYSLLPYEKIDALSYEKRRTSKIYSDFHATIKSAEFENLINNLSAQEPVQQFISKSDEKGLDLKFFQSLTTRIIGL